MIEDHSSPGTIGLSKYLIFAFGALASCGPVSGALCEGGSKISSDKIVMSVADRVARQSAYSNNPDVEKYSSAKDLMERNPSCCFIYINKKAFTGNIILPLTGESTVMIYYRKFRSGDKRYYKHYADLGACPENYEESGTREYDKYHEVFVGKTNAR